MCGGGGDDTQDQMRADERAREKKMAGSTRAINELFGIHNPANFGAGGVFDPTGGIEQNPLSYGAWAGENYAGKPAFSTTSRDSGDEQGNLSYSTSPNYGGEYGKYMKDLGWQAGNTGFFGSRNNGGDYLGYSMPDFEGPYGKGEYLGADPDAAGRAYENYGKREAAYGKSRGDIMNFFTHGLDEQMGDATQEQTYDLARRGLLKGSEDFQAEAGRSRRYDDSLLSLTNEADSSINKLRASDETSRLNLLQSIRAGMDRESAVAGATSNLRTNLDLSTNAAHATQFSNLFTDLKDIYKLNNYRTGQTAGAVSQGYGRGFPVGGSTSGSSYGGSIN